jgi:hypothetical protein
MSDETVIKVQKKKTEKVMKATIGVPLNADTMIKEKLKQDAKGSNSAETRLAAEESLEVLGLQDAEEHLEKELMQDVEDLKKAESKLIAEEERDVQNLLNEKKWSSSPLESMAEENSLEDLSLQNGGAKLGPRPVLPSTPETIVEDGEETVKLELTPAQYNALKKDITRSAMEQVLPLLLVLETAVKANQGGAIHVSPKQQHQQKLMAQKDRVKSRIAKIRSQMKMTKFSYGH